MTLRITEPGALLEHLTGGAGDHICPNIPGMGNGIAHPFAESLGFLHVVREAACEGLRLRDDGRGHPVDNRGTLEVVGERR